MQKKSILDFIVPFHSPILVSHMNPSIRLHLSLLVSSLPQQKLEGFQHCSLHWKLYSSEPFALQLSQAWHLIPFALSCETCVHSSRQIDIQVGSSSLDGFIKKYNFGLEIYAQQTTKTNYMTNVWDCYLHMKIWNSFTKKVKE